MKKSHIKYGGLVLVAMLVAAPFSARAAIIYEDDFSGAGTTQLGGATTDVGGGTWFNGNADNSSSFRADGSVVAGSAASGIWLPVSITAGNVYTLSADVDLTAGNWISLGYAQYASDASFFGSGGYGTVTVASGWVTAYAGLGTQGNAGAFAGAGSGVQQLKIVLDATDANSANWTMEFFENGVSLEGPVAAAAGDYGNIAHIGFSTANGSTTGTIDNFSLTVIPEPATLGLISMCGGGILFIRRWLIL